MKIAEAMIRISDLNNQMNLTEGADVFVYTDKNRTDILPFSVGVGKVMSTCFELNALKYALAVANVVTTVEFLNRPITLGELRLLITALRKQHAMLHNAYIQARKNPIKITREYGMDANGNQVVQNVKESLNGFTIEGLEAVLRDLKTQLQDAEGLLQRTNWTVDIPKPPVVK